MSIEDPREYARQCKIDKYEERMDRQIQKLKQELWLKDFEEDLTDKELLELCEYMNRHGMELSYIDLTGCKSGEDIMNEWEMVR